MVSKQTLSVGIEVTINLKYSNTEEGSHCPFVYMVSACSFPGFVSGGVKNTDNINDGENQQSGRGCSRDQHHPERPELGLYQLFIPVYRIRAPEIMLHCTDDIITQEELIY